MVNQSKCQCTMSKFEVSEVYVQSKRDTTKFFFIDAVCIDCNERQTISMHTMERGSSDELFREHYEMTKEFYKDLEA